MTPIDAQVLFASDMGPVSHVQIELDSSSSLLAVVGTLESLGYRAVRDEHGAPLLRISRYGSCYCTIFKPRKDTTHD